MRIHDQPLTGCSGYIVDLTDDEVLNLVRLGQDPVFLDTETTGLKILGYKARDRAVFVGLLPRNSTHVLILDYAQFQQVWPALEHHHFVGQNARFDFHALNVTPTLPWGDTMLASYYRNTARKKDLDYLTRLFTEFQNKIPTPEALKTPNGIYTLPKETVYAYLADDVGATRAVWLAGGPSYSFDEVFERVVLLMEQRGISLLRGRLQTACEVCKQEITRTRQHLLDAGFPQKGNLDSPQQLAKWLSGLGYKLPRTERGALSCDKITLETLARGGDLLTSAILEYRKLSKLHQAFLVRLPFHQHTDGKIYPSVKTASTVTGRLSYADPNLQQIPKGRSLPLAKEIRRSLYDERGISLADYSQVEMRVAAALANEDRLLTIFAQNEDIHTGVAAQMTGKALDKVTPEERFGAKAVNFGILNGMGATRLSFELRSSLDDARRFLDNYRRTFPKLTDWMNQVWIEAENANLASTLAGRTRVFAAHEETRPAISVIIQGTAAELMRRALIAVEEAGLEPLLSIHDEIVCRGKGRGQELAAVMRTAANTAFPEKLGIVDFTADYADQDTWGG